MPAHNAYRVRHERRLLLEAAYQDDLIAEYTQVSGGGGTRWIVDTHTDPTPTTLTTSQIPTFVNALRMGVVSTGTLIARRPPTADRTAISYADLPAVYGVPVRTFRVWVTRKQFPANLIKGAIRYPSGRVSFREAYVARGDALHWGRSTGRLHHDGTPNVLIANANTARDLATAA